jgi:hypothetical protein
MRKLTNRPTKVLDTSSLAAAKGGLIVGVCSTTTMTCEVVNTNGTTSSTPIKTALGTAWSWLGDSSDGDGITSTAVAGVRG